MKKLTIFLGAFVFLGLPSLTYASSYAYTCADVDFTEGGGSCASGTVTISSNDSDIQFKASSYSLTNGVTYYVYASSATGGGTLSIGGYKSGSGFAWVNHAWDPSVSVSTSFTTTGPSGSDLSIANTSSVPNTFIGSFGPVCISDVSHADAQAACGITPPSPSSDSPYFATTSIQVWDNPTADLFMVFATFFAAMVFVIWLFRSGS